VSSLDGGLDLLGLSGPRQQPLELAGLGPVGDHALEHVGKLGLRLDPVRPAATAR
jgi:hypothetical protein